MRSPNWADDHKCWVIIDGQTDFSSWYHIWESVTALRDMCVRFENTGSETGLGIVYKPMQEGQSCTNYAAILGDRRLLRVDLIQYYG